MRIVVESLVVLRRPTKIDVPVRQVSMDFGAGKVHQVKEPKAKIAGFLGEMEEGEAEHLEYHQQGEHNDEGARPLNRS